MEPKYAAPRLQQPDCAANCQPDESSPHSANIFHNDSNNIIFPATRLVLPAVVFLSVPQQRNCHSSHPCYMSCPSYQNNHKYRQASEKK
jgi:hypothetical protein